ncbi:TPA: hypothetical protein ROX88_003238 [Bacillus pseudomycoides]|nr:hypothetical protein [Bacillus pseudomycoides]
MSTEKTKQEQTSADSKLIGFNYQYYYFLYMLMQLRSGEEVGFEIKDDVHIEKSDGNQILIQLKHSIETKAGGEIKNLTEKDNDLWKTINNWIEMVNDKAENRVSLKIQKDYMSKTDFVLVSNKSSSSKNKFLKNLTDFQSQSIELGTFRTYLEGLISNQSSEVDSYIKNLLLQEDEWLKLFLEKVKVELDQDEIIQKIKIKIKEKNVNENRVDLVFASIDSNLKQHIYEDIKNRKKVLITFDEFYKRYTKYFELGTLRKLPIRLPNKKAKVPSSPHDCTSIKQLLDSGILDFHDDDYEEQLVDVFTCMQVMYNNVNQWYQDSEITEDEMRIFDNEAIRIWKIKFDKIHRKLKQKLRNVDLSRIPQDELIDLAAECYYEVLEVELTIEETDLNLEMSNGQYYLLSDTPKIGWLYHWKELYQSQ